jgi:O6-methylguanine-DNA--protein-cysteine methyltransferase
VKSLLRLLPAFLLFFTLAGCGGSSSGGTTPVSSSIAIQVSSPTVTVSQGSSASATVAVTRTGTTGNVTLSLTGLPAGATATYQNPAAGSGGQITINTTAAATAGTYPLTVQATDGTYSASANLSLVITAVSNSIAIQLSSATLTLTQGASGSDTVTVTRTGTTGDVTLSLTGLPTGATATYQDPAAGNSGQITVNTTAAIATGTYPLTLEATDGTYSASASLSLVISAVPLIPTSYSWTSTGPIISAKSDATHNIIAVKDPSAVLYNGRWVIYASTVDSNGNYGMEYLNVAKDWSDASTATPYFLDYLPGTAPQVFYFAPQNKWYLIYQWTPQFSTNSDPTQPQNWTPPSNFFASQPSSVSAWIDFWVICDSENCYLFFCGDNGNFYRSSTPIGDFPNGFNTPVIVDSSSEFDMFEADNVYSVEGTGQYLANIECLGPQGQRYFRALWASSLGGTWTSLGNTDSFSTPFLGQDNVTFNSGVSNWTTSFSSGGLLIDGNDQTDSVDPNNLQFLYQGADPSAYSNDTYGMIPWQLGLATATTK